MSSAFPHPSLSTPVTEEQRDRAEDWLKNAYAEGRLEPEEFDGRMGQLLAATNRGELNEAFYGLVSVPTATAAVVPQPSYAMPVRSADAQQGRGVAGLAHFSALPAWLVGPALVYALSAPGSYARREAAKAFNFQLISTIGLVVGGTTAAILDPFEPVMGMLWVVWLVLTIVGGVKALHGQDWRNPVRRVVKLEVLPEGDRRRR